MSEKFRIKLSGTEPLYVDTPILDPETGVPLIDERTNLPFFNRALAFQEVPVVDTATGLPTGETRRVNLIAPVRLQHRMTSLAMVGPLAGRVCHFTLMGAAGEVIELSDLACEVHAEALDAAIAAGLIERVE